ncbi:MAG: glycosyltransferase, partial [Parvularculaceae bacterium]
ALEKLARRRGVYDRVRFLGAVPHERLAEVYNAVDALLLASSREGWPNVLLEAMACGTPVVATPVHGSVEIVGSPAAGRLARERSTAAIVEALAALFAEPPARAETRRYAEGFSWEETAANLEKTFAAVAARRQKSDAVRLRPIKLATDCPPRLLVTIDAEEMFDWSALGRSARAVAPAKDIDRFQSLAAYFGVRPLYFLTYPVIDDAAARAYFRNLRADDAADLGVHFHQWSTPPLEGFDGDYYSYQSNLPPEIQRKKAAYLAERFIIAFGARPRAHRAGRYGMTKSSYEALAAIGVDYDFSPSPAFDFSRSGGPDFSRMTNEPFAIRLGDGASIAVTPVCGAATIRGERLFLPRRPKGGAGFDGALTRLPQNFFAPLRLSPEGSRLSELKALTRRLIADKTRILTFSLHSTTMTPGANPYARNEKDVEAILETCRKYFEFFNDIGGEFMSFGELQSLYGATDEKSGALTLTAH